MRAGHRTRPARPRPGHLRVAGACPAAPGALAAARRGTIPARIRAGHATSADRRRTLQDSRATSLRQAAGPRGRPPARPPAVSVPPGTGRPRGVVACRVMARIRAGARRREPARAPAAPTLAGDGRAMTPAQAVPRGGAANPSPIAAGPVTARTRPASGRAMTHPPAGTRGRATTRPRARTREGPTTRAATARRDTAHPQARPAGPGAALSQPAGGRAMTRPRAEAAGRDMTH